MLNDLIARYAEAKRVWEAQFDVDCEEASDSPEWDAYEQAEAAVLHFPCQSIEDVRAKAAFVLADANAFDTVRNCYEGGYETGEHSLKPFLRSLMGFPTDKKASL